MTEQEKEIKQLTEQVEYYKNLSHCLSGWRMDDAKAFCLHGEEYVKEKVKLYETIIDNNQQIRILQRTLVDLIRK